MRTSNNTLTIAPPTTLRRHTSMGVCRHGQGNTCPPPPGKVVKCFGALLMTVKCSVDELFTHYFRNLRHHLEAFSSLSSGVLLRTPLGDGRPRPPNLPTSEKILRALMYTPTVSAHRERNYFNQKMSEKRIMPEIFHIVKS